MFVFCLFLGPLLAAFLWYYGFSAVLLPPGKSNHVRLIQPVATLSEFKNELHDNGSISLETLRHKWTIVHFIGATCAAQCQKLLYNTRQTRMALGKDAHRVQRIALVGDSALAAAVRKLHADIALVKPSGRGLAAQLSKINSIHNPGSDNGLLIDPLGNVMMVVSVSLDPGKLLKDLKKLLKLSRIG